MPSGSNTSATFRPSEPAEHDMDERLKIEGDPEDALRVLLRPTKPEKKK